MFCSDFLITMISLTLQTTSVEYSKNLLRLTTIEKNTIDRQIVRDFLLDVSMWGLRMQLSLSTAMARMVVLEPVREIWARGSSQGTRRGWIWGIMRVLTVNKGYNKQFYWYFHTSGCFSSLMEMKNTITFTRISIVVLMLRLSFLAHSSKYIWLKIRKTNIFISSRHLTMKYNVCGNGKYSNLEI